MVEAANPDQDGVVRTVTVAFRPHHKSDTGRHYMTKNANRMTIGVQRFTVLLTAEEMSSGQEQEKEQVPAASKMMLN